MKEATDYSVEEFDAAIELLAAATVLVESRLFKRIESHGPTDKGVANMWGCREACRIAKEVLENMRMIQAFPFPPSDLDPASPPKRD